VTVVAEHATQRSAFQLDRAVMPHGQYRRVWNEAAEASDGGLTLQRRELCPAFQNPNRGCYRVTLESARGSEEIL